MYFLGQKVRVLLSLVTDVCRTCFSARRHYPGHNDNDVAESSQASSHKKSDPDSLGVDLNTLVTLSVSSPDASQGRCRLELSISHDERSTDEAANNAGPGSDCILANSQYNDEKLWDAKTQFKGDQQGDAEATERPGSAPPDTVDNVNINGSEAKETAFSLSKKTCGILSRVSGTNQTELDAKKRAHSSEETTSSKQEVADVPENSPIMSTDAEVEDAARATILRATGFQVATRKRRSARSDHGFTNKKKQRPSVIGKNKQGASVINGPQQLNQQSRPHILDPRATPFKFSPAKTPALSPETPSFEPSNVPGYRLPHDAMSLGRSEREIPIAGAEIQSAFGLGIQYFDGADDRAVKYNNDAPSNQFPFPEIHPASQYLSGPSTGNTADLDQVTISPSDVSLMEKRYVGYYVSGDDQDGSAEKEIEYFAAESFKTPNSPKPEHYHRAIEKGLMGGPCPRPKCRRRVSA